MGKKKNKKSKKAPGSGTKQAEPKDAGQSGGSAKKAPSKNQSPKPPAKKPKPKKSGGSGRLIAIIALVIGAAFVALNLSRLVPREGTEISLSVAEEKTRAALTTADAAPLGPYIADRFSSGQASTDGLPSTFTSPVASAAGVVVREKGKRLETAWAQGDSPRAALDAALAGAKSKLSGGKSPDALEVTLAYNFRTVTPGSSRQRIGNVYRGVLGLETIHNGKVTRTSPLDMVAQNRGFEKVLARFERKNNLGKGATQTAAVRVRLFDADQMIVQLPEKRAALTFRGNELIDIGAVTQESTRALAATMGDWLFASLHPDGREVYKYWPSQEKEARSNNMIRQWMATVALGRVAADRDDRGLFDRASLNIRYNLSQFYQEEDGFGLIDFKDQVKLGAVALAALSMIEHPDRAKFSKWEDALYRTTLHLWNEGGKFNTFFKPKGADRNHNFYPGETLLYWGAQYEDKQDPELLKKFMASVDYYKDWHLNNRNPAFIPWHTQAHYKVWVLNQDPVLRDWTFTMNDWLLGVQQWDKNTRFPDTNGRFYDAHRPFGPPHASSTGVYLEGLIDAWRMAKAVGDKTRQESYRQAIIRGIRSIMQLTFLDDVDMYYISAQKRPRVHGGVRTTVYDNVIRVDNVQHALMGILKILEYFAPEDYRP